jgi:hypothetical protein
VRRRRGAGFARAEDYIPVPQRPYRDSAIFYAILAACVVGVAFATGGDLVRALIWGGAFFAVATAWSWWRFRQRLEEQRAAALRSETETRPSDGESLDGGRAAEIERSDR